MIWKDIPGYEGLYRLNINGQIESCNKMMYKTLSPKKLVKLSKNKSGYIFVNLSKRNIKQMFQIQKLMALTFAGGVPHGKVVDHIDADKTNNNINNLQFITQRENAVKELLLKNGYVDIYQRKDNNKWRARLQLSHKRLSIGNYDTINEALLEYDKACIEHNIVNYNITPIEGVLLSSFL